MKIINILGATGLVGRHTIELLLADPNISKINSVSRRSLDIVHPKLNEIITPLEKLNDVALNITGDVLILALGASMQSKGNYHVVDLDFGQNAAQIAKKNGINRCVAISSTMASQHSLSKYLRIKAAFERELKEIAFEELLILRPGPLLGRQNERWQERLLNPIFKFFAVISGGKHSKISGVQAEDVARTIHQFCLAKTPKTDTLNSYQINSYHKKD